MSTPLCEIRGCLEIVGGCRMAAIGLCPGCPADHLCVKHYLGLISLLDRTTGIHWPIRASDEGSRAPVLNEADAAKVLNWDGDWKRSRAASKAPRKSAVPVQLAFPWRPPSKRARRSPASAALDQTQRKKIAAVPVQLAFPWRRPSTAALDQTERKKIA